MLYYIILMMDKALARGVVFCVMCYKVTKLQSKNVTVMLLLFGGKQ